MIKIAFYYFVIEICEGCDKNFRFNSPHFSQLAIKRKLNFITSEFQNVANKLRKTEEKS